MALANPKMYGELGKELAKKPFWVQALLFWTLAAIWFVVGLVPHTQVWAVGLGVLFLVLPFASVARHRRRSAPT